MWSRDQAAAGREREAVDLEAAAAARDKSEGRPGTLDQLLEALTVIETASGGQ